MYILHCIVRLLDGFCLFSGVEGTCKVGGGLTAMTMALIWGKNYKLTKTGRMRGVPVGHS